MLPWIESTIIRRATTYRGCSFLDNLYGYLNFGLRLWFHFETSSTCATLTIDLKLMSINRSTWDSVTSTKGTFDPAPTLLTSKSTGRHSSTAARLAAQSDKSTQIGVNRCFSHFSSHSATSESRSS